MSAPRRAADRVAAGAALAEAADPLAGKPAELNVRDWLVMLVRTAAEIEHSLMVQYLYSAYSLGPVMRSGKVPGAIGWQQQLLIVAREEMGHLMSMQNALLLIGGAPNFDRRDMPWDSDFYPFPFVLQPLDKGAAADFVYAEMSAHLDGPPEPGRRLPFGERTFYELRDEIFDEVKRQHPRVQDHHVGQLFDCILRLLTATDPRTGQPVVSDDWFHADTYAQQASWDAWGKGYRPHPLDHEQPDTDFGANVLVAQMGSRTQLVDGLTAIASQGEAPHFEPRRARSDHDSPSHFDRFVRVYEQVRTVTGLSEAMESLPTNPSTMDAAGDDADPRTYIEHDGSRALAEISNLRYRMLLTNLAHSVRLAAAGDGHGKGARGFLLQRSFADMFNVKTLAGLLFDAPLTNDPADPRRAGPPFEMPYTTALPATDVDCWRTQLDLAEQSADLAETLLDDTALVPEWRRYLSTLVQLDRQDAARIGEIIDHDTRGGR